MPPLHIRYVVGEPFGLALGSGRRSTWACIWVVKAEVEDKVLIFSVGRVEGEAENNPLGLVAGEIEGNVIHMETSSRR